MFVVEWSILLCSILTAANALNQPHIMLFGKYKYAYLERTQTSVQLQQLSSQEKFAVCVESQ